MTTRSLSLLRRTGAIAVVPAVILSFAACSEKSEAQQANEWLGKGLTAHQAGRVEDATTAYQNVLKHDSHNKWGYYNLGLVAQSQNDYATAENNYRMALSIDPNLSPALFNLAIVRTAAGDKPGAELLYRKDLEGNPDKAIAHLNLGFLLRDMGRQAEGDAELAQAVRLDPSLASRLPAAPSPEATTTTTTVKAKR